jgi:hypothetical protein
MVKKKTPVELEFRADMLEKIKALKKYYSVQNDAERVRILVNESSRQLNVNLKETTANVS